MEDKESLLQAWSLHFGNLAKSRKEELRPLQELDSHMLHLESQSRENEDFILDTPFTTEEVYGALKKLKRGKSPGPDDLLAEHLFEGGEAVVNWLMKIFNAIVALEKLPNSLKNGIIVPVYKGSGRDPFYTPRQLQRDHPVFCCVQGVGDSAAQQIANESCRSQYSPHQPIGIFKESLMF